MKKEKLEPRLIDVQYLDRELKKLFASVPHGRGDDMFIKHKSRFQRQQKLKDDPDSDMESNSILSIGKKLEILCMYGGHRIVKADRASHIKIDNAAKSDNVAHK